MYARLWAAKEAVAKARGTGMTDPKKLEVAPSHGERLAIDGFTVETRRDGDYVDRVDTESDMTTELTNDEILRDGRAAASSRSPATSSCSPARSR